MKKIINKINAGVVIVIITVAFFSCKKTKETPLTPQGFIAFHLHTNIDTIEIPNYGIPYRNDSGRLVSLSLAQMYISNIKLIKADGSIVPLQGKIILKKFQQEIYNLDSVPAGNYNTVMFDVGLDSATNITDASSIDTSNILAAKDSMWTGWTWMGYLFVNVKGSIDTSTLKDGSKMAAFNYWVGSQKSRRTITMPVKPFSVQSKQEQFVHITIDYGNIFNGLNLHTQLNGGYNDPIATLVANNIPSMFRYEQ